ncbi:MAG: M20/M25/M40 family metallo-hydrolase [Chloroflexi bacterium]|nr:MAG: M20/M25/M40 family metallo-hydrolase [Chloroflexota bacterium]
MLLVLATACDVAPNVPATSSTSPARTTTPLVAAGFDGTAAHRHLQYLADPARNGRLTGSPGYQDAATYVADRFREIGLEPAGDNGTFFQHFPLKVPHLTANPSLTISGSPATTFRLRADFAELVGALRGGGEVEAPLVYVGGAAEAPSYSDFTPVDVRGKVVLVAGPMFGDPAENAIRHGAKAVLFVARDSAGPLIRYSELVDIAADAVPTLLVTEPVADRLVASSGRRIADLRAELEREPILSARKPLSFDTGVRVRVSVPIAPASDFDAMNVLGILRPLAASDKVLLVGGHLDGVGTDPDGTVYPAANDNASGPAVTIEIARALAPQRARLRHSVLFVAWAGEEQGLQGSTAFLSRAAGTVFATGNLLSYINLDIVGCCGETLGASAENPSLYGLIHDAAKKQQVTLGVTRGSSDHENFNRIGIPAAIVAWSPTGPIHTTADTVAGVDTPHLQMVGVVTIQAVLDLAGNG